MYVWWHNGGLRLDPANDDERAALALLWPDTRNDLPPEQRVRHGDGSVQPSGGAVGDVQEK